jgi:ribosome-associated toxin RatA of RatAB toxin-antitoxin module
MPFYGELRTARIAATQQACFDALTDFESLPRWQRAVRQARVLERDAQGRGLVVEYAIDVRVKTVRYRLRQIYDEPHRLGSEYLGGDFRDFCGEWRFQAFAPGVTCAELDLRIDPGRLVPAFVRRAIAEVVIGRALTDLKAYVESA